uniref:Kinesin light chain n=1 Tax=Lygus hesperus TaxID=30085 RepID=A0A146LKZ4_LYGHE
MACAKEEMGEYVEMKTLLLESLAVHEQKFTAKHAKVGRVLLQLTRAHGYCNEPEAQLRTAERALGIIQGHCGPTHLQTTNAMMAVADAYGANRDVHRQLQLAQHVMERL